MPELPFTLDQLRILKAIAAEGSFKKAADLLYVTQPAVSLQIQNLEKQLEITIFDRGGRKALLTEGGRPGYKGWGICAASLCRHKLL